MTNRAWMKAEPSFFNFIDIASLVGNEVIFHHCDGFHLSNPSCLFQGELLSGVDSGWVSLVFDLQTAWSKEELVWKCRTEVRACRVTKDPLLAKLKIQQENRSVSTWLHAISLPNTVVQCGWIWSICKIRPHAVRALWSISLYPQKQWTLVQWQYLVLKQYLDCNLRALRE